MIYVMKDKRYRFRYAFDSENGTYVRTGVLDENDRDTGIDPFMGLFPHLIDVGIMGHCIHGKTGLCVKAGIGCYQSGMKVEEENMSVSHFRWIAEQCRGRCNQLAFGGRGDPDQHEHFGELLQISRENNLVPNFTTSGYGMTPKLAEICSRYCGAVAVSWYRSVYTVHTIQMLLDAGVRTNIHYVLGNNSIDEAIERLEHDDFPDGINAVIFLLHKPAGMGTEENVIRVEDARMRRFFHLIERKHSFRIGMDSCTVPGAVNYCHNIVPESLDTCEGGRFSCYIGPDMIMTPCSFDQRKQYITQLSGGDGPGMTISEAWNSEPFARFRKKLKGACPTCKSSSLCMGGCPLMPEIVLCKRKERTTL